MKIFFLDDDKERHRRFLMNRIGMDITPAWNYEEACQKLAETVFDVAYLDHDLSDMAAAGMPEKDEKTGTDVAEFIVTLPEDKRPKFVIIHSYNFYGARRMLGILANAGQHCMLEMFKG